MKKLIAILFSLLMIQASWAAGITFTFANVTFTGTSPSYYEFDVMAQADAAGTKLGDNQVYLNYNTLGFGNSIVSSGKTTVTKGTLLEGGSAPFFYYTIVNYTDNTNSRLAISSGYNYPDSPEFGNDLPTVATQLLHVKIEIADANQTAGLSFEPSLMTGQEYESDNSAKYDPVIATDTENSLLTPSTLENLVDSNVPEKFALRPNFPNPFNPTTTLEFDVPEISKDLQLAIYDILGQKVVQLYQGSLKPGTFRFQWNGRNAQGFSMPSGSYFAVLNTESFSQTIKMVLIK